MVLVVIQVMYSRVSSFSDDQLGGLGLEGDRGFSTYNHSWICYLPIVIQIKGALLIVESGHLTE